MYRTDIVIENNQEDRVDNVLESKKVLKTGRRSAEGTMKLWHERLGHISYDTLETMQKKEIVRGLPDVLKKNKDEICDTCKEMKSTRLPFKEREEKRATEILEIVHSDVCGPIDPKIIGGNRFFVTFTDDRSRKSDVFFMTKKSEVLEKFKMYKLKSEGVTGKRF
jgi:hypothetical protein